MPSIRCASIAAISAAISAALCVADRAAHAESAEAAALFDRGDQLMAEGNVADACAAFEASNRAEPRAGTLIHLGVCRERNRQLASAWSAYNDALTRVKDAVKRVVAESRLAELAPRLSYLTISLSDDPRTAGLTPTLTLNGAAFDPSLWNHALPVDGGDYVIAGHAPGHRDWQTTVHVAAEQDHVSVTVPRLEEEEPPRLAELPAGPPPSRFTTRRKLALGVAGASTLCAAAGVVLGAMSLSKQHEASSECPDPEHCTRASSANDLVGISRHRAIEADVAFGIAAAAAIGAGVLWFTGAPGASETRTVHVVPSITSREAGIAIVGRL